MTEQQREQIVKALAGAFDRQELAGLAHADAGVSLTPGEDENARAFAVRLVQLAERNDKLDYLIMAAVRARPDNEALARLMVGALADAFGKKTPAASASAEASVV